MFADLKSPLVKHFYCSFCLMKVNSDTKICPNVICSKSFQTIGKLNFIDFSLEYQLKALFKREAFRENLKHSIRRMKKNRDALEDIYDGDINKSLSGENQPLADINNISQTWNTDGVPVFKSSNVSIGPMYLMINELPLRRESVNQTCFYGLWFGVTKPDINLSCGPLLETLVKEETEGILVSFEQQNRFAKAFLICGTADLPAKCAALNMNQCNGEYSCLRCLQKGRTEKVGKGYTHIFPVSQENPVGSERTKTDVYKCAAEATKSKKRMPVVSKDHDFCLD